MGVRVASGDLNVHVAVRVEGVHDRHRLAVLGVDLSRDIFDLQFRLPVRGYVELVRFAGHHLGTREERVDGVRRGGEYYGFWSTSEFVS